MPWLLLLLAVATLVIAFATPSIAVLVLCLVAAFGATIVATMHWLARGSLSP